MIRCDGRARGGSTTMRTSEDKRRVSGCGRGVESADDVEKWREKIAARLSGTTLLAFPPLPLSFRFSRELLPPPSLPFALTRSNRGIPRIRGRSMNLFCRRDDRIREWDAPEKNILENRVLKIQSFFLLIRSRKSLFYFEILFSENFIRAMKLWIWKENARIEEGMIRWRKKKKRKKGSRAALLIELAKD